MAKTRKHLSIYTLCVYLVEEVKLCEEFLIKHYHMITEKCKISVRTYNVPIHDGLYILHLIRCGRKNQTLFVEKGERDNATLAVIKGKPVYLFRTSCY